MRKWNCDLNITATSHEHDDVPTHRHIDCFFRSLFRLTTKKSSTVHITILWEGNPSLAPVTNPRNNTEKERSVQGQGSHKNLRKKVPWFFHDFSGPKSKFPAKRKNKKIFVFAAHVSIYRIDDRQTLTHTHTHDLIKASRLFNWFY